jgi:sulfur carrier protein ThiS
MKNWKKRHSSDSNDRQGLRRPKALRNPKLAFKPQTTTGVMDTILFNAFSFLQKKLRAKNIPCTNAVITITKGQSAKDVLDKLGIEEQDIEGVFVNGRIMPVETLLNDKDRLAALPRGTPGPYRLLLGLVKQTGQKPGNETK